MLARIDAAIDADGWCERSMRGLKGWGLYRGVDRDWGGRRGDSRKESMAWMMGFTPARKCEGFAGCGGGLSGDGKRTRRWDALLSWRTICFLEAAKESVLRVFSSFSHSEVLSPCDSGRTLNDGCDDLFFFFFN